MLTLASEYPVKTLCRVLGVSRSGYYRWQAHAQRPCSTRAAGEQRLRAEVRASHARSRGRYGAPRILADLRAQGIRTARKRVQRLLREEGLSASPRRRRCCTTESRHTSWPSANRLGRDFQAAAPNQKWCADITYIATQEGWLFLAVVVDLFSRRVVGHASGATLETTLVARALQMALSRRRVKPGLLHHSDRGCQYASAAYRLLLARHGMAPSMSRRGNCYDNAVVESFFATLKRELVRGRLFATRAEASGELFAWIELCYNAERRHSSLGYVSPAMYEASYHAAQHSQAA